ncbi:MAG: hypothetical protein ACYCXT_13710 [Acidiferrobacteraceae bacterium]
MQPHLSATAAGLRDGAVYEPQGQLLGHTMTESFFKTPRVERVYQIHYEIWP